MAGSTTKKVRVTRFDREPVLGYVNPQTYLRGTGVELLTPDGGFSTIPYEDVKTVCFVRDFEAPEPAVERRTFHTRPKMDGLWVRARFRDGEILDGILANNLLQLDAQGFTLIPPDPTSNNQRLFLPRAALTEIQVLGVVGSPLRRPKPKPAPQEQIGLFDGQ
ncbi:MAG TPA: hypothetical protein VFA33_11285 [Bryobacteraceae bacterium]|nr:hypothetical protein [Bryobacteraceae bacterium]